LEKIIQHWYDVPYLKKSEKIIYILSLIKEFENNDKNNNKNNDKNNNKNEILKLISNKKFLEKNIIPLSLRKIKQFFNRLFSKYNSIKYNNTKCDIKIDKLLLLVYFDFIRKLKYVDLIYAIRLYELSKEEFIEEIKEVSGDEEFIEKIKEFYE